MSSIQSTLKNLATLVAKIQPVVEEGGEIFPTKRESRAIQQMVKHGGDLWGSFQRCAKSGDSLVLDAESATTLRNFLVHLLKEAGVIRPMSPYQKAVKK